MSLPADSGPYRRSLPQVRQVFCIDCEHSDLRGRYAEPYCSLADVWSKPDPYDGMTSRESSVGCRARNAKRDCKDFSAKRPKEPLWARLFRWLCRHPKGQ